MQALLQARSYIVLYAHAYILLQIRSYVPRKRGLEVQIEGWGLEVVKNVAAVVVVYVVGGSGCVYVVVVYLKYLAVQWFSGSVV